MISSITETFSLVKYVEKALYQSCKIIHICLIIAFYTLLTLLSCFYLSTLFKLQKADNFYQILFWLTLGIWIQFNMIFNYTLSVLTKPGSPKNFEKRQISYIDYRCAKCHYIKPPRTHHCSICNQCILQMDHHCPWIGQCVGHHNRRYFLNFLTYTSFGLGILAKVQKQYMDSSIYQLQKTRRQISINFTFQIFAFVVSLFFCLSIFCIFHWFLAIKGKTTLQFCFDNQRYQSKDTILQNLQIIYGSKNILTYLLPSFQILNKYEWKDNNFASLQIQIVGQQLQNIETDDMDRLQISCQ